MAIKTSKFSQSSLNKEHQLKPQGKDNHRTRHDTQIQKLKGWKLLENLKRRDRADKEKYLNRFTNDTSQTFWSKVHKTDHIWRWMEGTAQDRNKWRTLVGGLCPRQDGKEGRNDAREESQMIQSEIPWTMQNTEAQSSMIISTVHNRQMKQWISINFCTKNCQVDTPLTLSHDSTDAAVMCPRRRTFLYFLEQYFVV